MRLVFFAVALTASFASAEFKRLHAERATATSFLESNWNKYQENYHPTYVLDDDPSTAWVEGAEGDGVGQSLTVKVSALNKARALRLVITPGYQKSKALFAANGTPTALEVKVTDAQDKQTASKRIEVAAKWGTQTFDLPLTGGLGSVTLTIDAVKAGTKYRDTCISDLQLFVDSDVPYDKRVEEAKRTAMLAWKKERLAAAKYFGSLPVTYPFASTSWTVTDDSSEFSRRYSSVSEPNGEGGFLKGVKNPKFLELDALIERGSLPDGFDGAAFKTLRGLVKDSKGGAWFSVSSKTPVRMPDGLEDLFLPEVLPLARATDLTFFEASKPELALTLRPVKRDSAVPREAALSTLKLLEGTATAPKRAFAKHVEVVFERADYEITTWLLFEWGDDGLLRKLAFWREEVEISGGGRMMEPGFDPKEYPEVRKSLSQSAAAWSFTVADGKISRIDRQLLLSVSNEAEGITGLLEDEGIRSIRSTFVPRQKK